MDKELIIINRIQKQLKDLKPEDRCRILAFCQERSWRDRDEERNKNIPTAAVLDKSAPIASGTGTFLVHD